ncbi:sensor histidine kinase [Sphingomonas sp. M1-B02]|uniref:sensor histidine kinase n=1 Tax=Sphingomonas sp. M1-B02 TaxID=3114300 RepID=UPI0022408CCD|nr:histidine kinase dimerization/phosphoacceptor domain -containing protein [Sphingomonas sp. S6-11]UZK65154.1 ATP-binding protein [Sphingomonas sp. S6-11]
MKRSERPASRLERLPIAANRPLLAVTGTLALVVLAYFARLGASDWLPPGFPYVTFFPAVLLASFVFGWRMGAIAAILCGLLSWYYFIPPLGFVMTGPTAIALAFYVFVVTTDIAIIHLMQRANTHLAAERERSRVLAETQELLFAELQHRVSNNLQVVAGLLTLQKRQVTDPDARAAMDEAARRLGTIGRISRQLYEMHDHVRGLDGILGPLGADVIEASGRTGISQRLSLDDSAVPPASLTPIALIVAEAVANAIEHGFAGRETGEIEIACTRDGANLRIEVRDDGNGLPEEFELGTSGSLGLQIATMLAGQLGGRFEMIRGERTIARLTIAA